MSHKPKNTENSSRNAATHGLSCEKFFLTRDETAEEFNAHAQAWFEEYKDYDSPLLKPLLKDVVQAHWLQQRAYRRLFESETALAMAEMNQDPAQMTDEIFRRLQLIQRYKTNYENSYQRAFRALEAFRKTRNAEKLGRARFHNVQCSTIGQMVKSFDRLVAHGFTKEQAIEKIEAGYAFVNGRWPQPKPDGQTSEV